MRPKDAATGACSFALFVLQHVRCLIGCCCCSGQPEWCNAGDSPKYCVEHIQRGWDTDWANDEHAISAWLGDYPQDHIVVAASIVLGAEKVSQLATTG